MYKKIIKCEAQDKSDRTLKNKIIWKFDRTALIVFILLFVIIVVADLIWVLKAARSGILSRGLFLYIQAQMILIGGVVFEVFYSGLFWKKFYWRKGKTSERCCFYFLMINLILSVYIQFFLYASIELLIRLWWMLLSWCVIFFQIFALKVRNTISEKQDKYKGIIYSLGVCCISSFFMFSIMEILCAVQFYIINVRALVLNFLCYFVLLLVLFAATKRVYIAALMGIVFSIVFGLVNYYYYQFRGVPFEYSDILAAGTAEKVIDNYSFELSPVVVLVLIACIVVVSISTVLLRKSKVDFSNKMRVALLGMAVIIVVVIGQNIPEVGLFDIKGTCRENGYLYSFLGYAKSLENPSAPQGYDGDMIDDILLEYAADSNEGNTPNIIVIMNEAFADLPNIYDFETSADALPFIHSLEENTIKGEALVSVFGGGTANSEFEFLTGNSMACLPPSSIPYMQFVEAGNQSLVGLLKERGYTTIAYHPYERNGWRRDLVYSVFGFDKFYSIEDDLPSKENIRSYLSDAADFENIIYLYEQYEDAAPLFLFNVTMQSHGGYSSERSAIEVTVTPEESAYSVQLEEYLSLIRETDRAFEGLVDYFSEVDEDTIILMFGDHQPGLGTEAYDRIGAAWSGVNVGLEEMQQMYRTTFVIWANFDIEEKSDMMTSLNYLRPLLLKSAKMELSNYDNFLLTLMKDYPAVFSGAYCDVNEQWYNIGTWTGSILEQYSWLVHNNMFDKNNMDTDYYK